MFTSVKSVAFALFDSEGVLSILRSVQHDSEISSAVTLTTHRVRYESRGVGKYHLISISLEALCSLEMQSKSHPILLLLMGLSLAVGVYCAYATGANQGWEARLVNAMPGWFVGMFFWVAWALTRRQKLEIASAAAIIRMPLSGIGNDVMSSFIQAVEAAKKNRSDALANKPSAEMKVA